MNKNKRGGFFLFSKQHLLSGTVRTRRQRMRRRRPREIAKCIILFLSSLQTQQSNSSSRKPSRISWEERMHQFCYTIKFDANLVRVSQHPAHIVSQLAGCTVVYVYTYIYYIILTSYGQLLIALLATQLACNVCYAKSSKQQQQQQQHGLPCHSNL